MIGEIYFRRKAINVEELENRMARARVSDRRAICVRGVCVRRRLLPSGCYYESAGRAGRRTAMQRTLAGGGVYILVD